MGGFPRNSQKICHIASAISVDRNVLLNRPVLGFME
jgi:hypothetical protein